MKFHLSLLAGVPDVSAILAVNSLSPWELPYESYERTPALNVDKGAGDWIRCLCVEGCEDPSVTATRDGDNIAFRRTDQPLPEDIALVLAAVGLGGHGVELGRLDADVFYERVSCVDAAWSLLRKLKKVLAADTERMGAAVGLIELAKTAQANALERINNGESPALRRREQAAEEHGRSLAKTIPGLKGLGLCADPRGSALKLLFEGDHDEYYVAPLSFGWAHAPVAPPQMAAPERGSMRSKFAVRPTAVKADVLGVLHGAVVEGTSLRITQKLSKKLYDQVNELLIDLGGKWHTGRQAHVFEQDPSARLQELLRTGTVFTRRDFEFFPTPETVGRQVIREANLQPGMKVLEPEAGAGALALLAAEVVGKDSVTCFELMPENVERLQAAGFAISGAQDFLEIAPQPVMDAVVMNPPFSNGRDIAHILQAMKWLKPGGRLAAVASPSWELSSNKASADFRDLLRTLGATVIKIRGGAFKEAGTDVATTLIAFNVPAGAPARPVDAPRAPAPVASEQQALF